MKYDIITFGSATLDIFLTAEELSIEAIEKFVAKKGVCFPLGSKINVSDLHLFTGGGGTNTAATFALQGLKVAYCGKVGQDFAGKEILKDLRKLKIDTRFVLTTEKADTNISIIFSWGADRTCLVWRGASELLAKKEVLWGKLDAKWFYLAPLSGKLVSIFEPLVNFAYKNNIKLFVNLGDSQIRLGIRKLKPILSKIDILLLNQEEASLLTGISYQKEKQVFKKLDELTPGIAIMTKGANGAVVSDGNYLWQARTPRVKVIEKTGAGDAFGSGFLASYIKNANIERALQFGIVNSTSCIQKIGAKQGILKKGQSWKKVKVTRNKI